MNSPALMMRYFLVLCLLVTGSPGAAMAAVVGTVVENPGPLTPLPEPGRTATNARNLTFSDVVQRARSLKPLMERLRTAIDRSQFDLDELNFTLDFEPERIAEFVRKEIFFEQYVGVLRGAEGTLIGRAGNALDQSLLATALLEKAGYEWRINRGRLTSDQATALVKQMAKPRPAFPPAGDGQIIPGLLEEASRLQGFASTQRTPAKKRYLEITDSDTRFIQDALRKAGVTLGDPEALKALIEEARDYFWVDYRVDAYAQWKPIHPAFDGAPVPTVERQGSFQEPPEPLFHRVRFEVFAEQKFDDQLIVNSIVPAQVYTTASLVGKPFTYQNMPNNLDLENASGIDALLASVGLFVPTINTVPIGNGFDLDGRLFSVGGLSLDRLGATEISQAQGRKLETALSALDVAGKPEATDTRPDDFIALTAHWLEYTVVSPGGAETTHRRYTIDRIGTENRAGGIATITDSTQAVEHARKLLTSTMVMAIPNRYSTAYRLDRYAARMLKEIELLQYVVADPQLERFPRDMLKALVPSEDLALATVFDEGHAQAGNTLTYRTQPTLVAYQEGLNASTDIAFGRVDIVNHTRRTLDTSDELEFAPAAAVRAGVWESYAESVPLSGAGAATVTAKAFRDALAKDIPILVLLPGDAGSIDSLKHSAVTKDNLREILRSGDLVIVPAKPLPNETQTHWWRVNAASGETLGMATGGYGNVSTEFIIVARMILFTGNTLLCLEAGGGVGCCMGVALATLVLGKVISIKSLFDNPLAGVGLGLGAAEAGLGGLICADGPEP